MDIVVEVTHSPVIQISGAMDVPHQVVEVTAAPVIQISGILVSDVLLEVQPQAVEVVISTPGDSGRGWFYYATSWSVEPSHNQSITGGSVFDYTLDGVTRFRFVPTPYDPTLDAFYASFVGGALGGLIVRRAG